MKFDTKLFSRFQKERAKEDKAIVASKSIELANENIQIM